MRKVHFKGGTLLNKLVDTNILLNHPEIAKDPEIVISILVLEELDRLKTERGETGQKARVASNMLRKYKSSIQFDFDSELNPTMSVDDYLVAKAKLEDWILITEDIIVELKCEAAGVKCEEYSKEYQLNSIHYLFIPEDNQLISDVYSGVINLPLHENEYVCIKDKTQFFIRSNGEIDYTCVDLLQYKNGVYTKVIDKTIRTYDSEIRGLNPEQRCLINSLFDKNVSIVYAGGTWGVS